MHTIAVMPLKKIAIAVPPDVLKEIDRAARARHESRSRYISRVLRATARAKSDAEITRILDELFADPEIAGEQLRMTRQMRSIAARRDKW